MTTPTDPHPLAATLAALMEKATKGPWKSIVAPCKGRTFDFKRDFWEVGGGPEDKGVAFVFGHDDANAALIVFLRNHADLFLSLLRAGGGEARPVAWQIVRADGTVHGVTEHEGYARSLAASTGMAGSTVRALYLAADGGA